MQKYILDKTINGDKANNVKDLEDVGKTAWRFITSFYDSHQDGLMVDSTNRTFRNNIKSKFCYKSKTLELVNKKNFVLD